jgi:molecular chaperone IbpA
MRTSLDVSPFYRSSVGFDRVFDLLENATHAPAIDNWPPYDIAKTGDDAYRIQMAVAGFAQDDLTIIAEPNLLIVTGQNSAQASGEYLHRGIASRSFTRRFELADHVKVAGASLVNGLLTIELRREIPEAMKPRRIAITASPGSDAPQRINKQKKAA